MAKAPTKKTPAKTAKTRKAATKGTAPESVEGEAPAPEKKAKARKAAPKTPKAPADTRVVRMHGETRLTHHGEGEEAIAAVLPTVDAVNAGGKVAVTSVAHGPSGVSIHAVPAGHAAPYETNPGVVLTIGANGLMSFDHVAVGLATPGAIEETTLSVMDAVRPVEGEQPTTAGRRTDWYERAILAAGTMAERLAA